MRIIQCHILFVLFANLAHLIAMYVAVLETINAIFFLADGALPGYMLVSADTFINALIPC